MKQQSAQELYVFDSALPDLQTLVSALPADSDVLVLDRQQDGVLQLAQALRGLTGLDALHIFAHGSAGSLSLGTGTLNISTLPQYAAALATLGQALSDTADILLYGCAVAQGDTGQAFIAALAGATGAEVAASVDPTGSSALGGNWMLEASTGPVAADTVFNAAASGYAHLLAVIAGDAGANNLAGGTGDDSISGLGGNDTLSGLGGNDTIDGGDSNDQINGGVGNDSLLGGANDDALDGSAGNDTLFGGPGNDSLFYAPYDGQGNDKLFGDDGNDRFDIRTQPWNGYNETVTGTADGGAGDDIFLIQTDPVDTLTLTGGLDHDTYVFDYFFKSVGSPFGSPIFESTSPNTAITDFAGTGSSSDRIDLGELLIYSATLGGYTGGNPFAASSAYLRLLQVGPAVHLQWDSDGLAATSSFKTVLVLRDRLVADLSAANFTADNVAPSVFVEDLNGWYGTIDSVYETGFGFGSTRLSYAVLDPSGAASTGQVISGFTGRVIGSVANDSISGSAVSDYIAANAGNDTLLGNDGKDILLGGPGDDSLYGGLGDDYLYGELGNDRLFGEGGNDTLYYSTWNDRNGQDTLDGGSGNDHFIIASFNGLPESSNFLGGDGNDQFDVRTETQDALSFSGGTGTDTYLIVPEDFTWFSGSGALIQDFQVGAGGDQLDVHRLLEISAYQDANDPGGYLGGNPFNAALGYLRLTQSGANTLLQWDKDGVAARHGWATVFTLQNTSASGLTPENFVGGLAPGGGPVAGLNIVVGAAGGETHGSYFNDTLTGADGAFDRLYGEGGDDLIYGLGGNDQLYGGPGNDTLLGGNGDDSLSVVGFQGGGHDQLDGGAGNDYLESFDVGQSVTLSGGEGNDTLRFIERTANTFTSYFNGNAGNDKFVIGTWVDQPTLVISGGSGRDTYSFDQGSITVSFQVGSGVFATDFVTGANGDQLDFTELLTKSGLYGYTGGNPFEPALGYLRFVQSGADTLVQWDVDGASASAYTWDTVLVLQGVQKPNITADNIVGKLIQGTPAANLLPGTDWGSDRIQGLAGNDTLNGLAGSDSMEGGSGNDVYYVDSAGDLVIETDNLPSNGILLPIALANISGAIDKVVSSISYTLTAFVENLELLAGFGSINGTGNTLDNELSGNEGNNTLAGAAGNDIFFFASSANGVDQIADFSVGDSIRIAGANFSGAPSSGNGSAVGLNQVQVSSAGGSSTLYIGTNAIAGADVEIRISGTHTADDIAISGSQLTLANGKTVDLLAYTWNAHALLPGVVISAVGFSDSTNASGALRFANVPGANLTLTPSRAVTGAEAAATSSAVNIQDAIAILKMVVGLDVNGANRPLSPYQALAADLDGNGVISVSDAIAVLKHVVGLAAPDPTWHFLNESDMSVPAKAGLNPGAAQPSINASITGSSPVHIGLVGYLRGDVDGSYAGAVGALDLDATQPNYFQSLVQVTGLSLTQFGVYP